MDLNIIESKFATLSNVIAARNEAIKEMRAQIMQLEKEMAVIAEPYELTIQSLQTDIQNDIKTVGSSYKCKFGKATYRKAYERASWDDKALMGYAAKCPEIEQFRKVSVVEASVSISLDGEKK